jgi:AraC-like DNA-binding protein
MKLFLDRDPASFARARSQPEPALLFPLETTVVELVIARTRHRLDRSCFALVPPRLRHRITSRSPAPKLVTLLISASERQRAQREYAPHIEPKVFSRVLAESRILPRTRWVDELVHRYLFERQVCGRHASNAARFLETELVKELYFLGQEHASRQTRAPVVHEESALVERARQAIESELFAPFSTAELARRCHASESTLLRAFRRELGLPPSAYVRERRLDEALLLLESGRYSVGEVAGRVGYRGQAAFAAAFHKKFHIPPSRVEKTRATLPPHGRPPKLSSS